MIDNQSILDRAADILDYNEVVGDPLTLTQLIESAAQLLYDECPWDGVDPTATSAKMALAYRLTLDCSNMSIRARDLNEWADSVPVATVIAALRRAEVAA